MKSLLLIVVLLLAGCAEHYYDCRRYAGRDACFQKTGGK